MSTRISLHSHHILFLAVLFIFAASSGLELPVLRSDGSLENFMPQQSQIITNNVSTDVLQDEISRNAYETKQQTSAPNNGNVDDGRSSQADNYGGAVRLPVLSPSIVGSNSNTNTNTNDDDNVTSQTETPNVVANVATTKSTHEEEATKPSNKDISNSDGIMDAKSGPLQNSVTIDSEEDGQLGQNNESEILNSNVTHSDIPQQEKLPAQSLSSILPYNTLQLLDHKDNNSLERLVHDETVNITSKETDIASVGPAESDLLQMKGFNKSSSNNQSYQVHMPGGGQYKGGYLIDPKQLPLPLPSQLFQPQQQSYDYTGMALPSDQGNQQKVQKEHVEFPLQPTNSAELPAGKQELPQQYHPQQEQKEQPLELPKLPLYQYSPLEQQQKEQPLELPKLPLYNSKEQAQQQQEQKEQPLELPKLPLYQYSPKEQQQEHPLELAKLPLNQYDPKEQQQKEQSIGLSNPTLYQDNPKEQEQKEQPLELPKLPLYQYNPKEQEQKEQPLELPKLPLYQYNPKEQQQKEQPLELPKLPLYQYNPKEQQQKEQPLELPKLPLYQYNPKEQQQKEQPLELPKLPLYQYNPKEQQQKEQPLELPKLPLYQYNPKEQQEQSLELPKLAQYEHRQQEQKPQPQESKYGQPVELSRLPLDGATLPNNDQELLEHSQAHGANSNDNEGYPNYVKTGDSLMPSDESSNDSTELNTDEASSPFDDKQVSVIENHLPNYELPVSSLGKQTDTDYRQKTKWESVYKDNNKGQDALDKEVTNDGGYYEDGDDDDDGEEYKGSNWATEKDNTEDGYVNKEGSDNEEGEHGDIKKTYIDDESDAEWDVKDEDDDQDDFGSENSHLVEDVVDEDMAKNKRLPTAPTSMVLFYTWMIVAVLIFVVGISMYQSRCHGFRFRLPGIKSSSSGSDRKRLLDHEFV